MYLNDVYSSAANLAGTPALSGPFGAVSDQPASPQIIGAFFQEGQLVDTAQEPSQAPNWHLARLSGST